MKTSLLNPFRPSRCGLLVAWASWMLAGSAFAEIHVDAVVTPVGSSYRFDIAVRNDSTEDVALISLVDAPTADPLIGSTLVLPTGFQGSYDAGLGIVDFLADTGIFAVGQEILGFRFDAQTFDPGNFVSFEALGVQGTLFTGSIRYRPPVVGVPDGGSTLAQLSLAGLVLVRGWRKATSSAASR